MIAVDTSVWIDLFRGTPTAEVDILAPLVRRGRALVGDLVLCELLQGLRTQREVILVEDALAAFQVVPMVGARVARHAAANYRTLRGLDVTVRKTVDLLIATWCLDNDVPLLHRDRDFDPFETYLGLRILRAA